MMSQTKNSIRPLHTIAPANRKNVGLLDVLSPWSDSARFVLRSNTVWLSLRDVIRCLHISKDYSRQPERLMEYLGVQDWNTEGYRLSKDGVVYIPYLIVARMCAAIVNNFNPSTIIDDHEGLELAYKVNELFFPKTSECTLKELLKHVS